MKLSVIAATGLFAVVIGTTPKKCSKNCFNAIVSDTPPSIGEAFCSSFLSLKPLDAATATVTVVRDAFVTTTNTNSETTTTTVTTTDATITTTTGTVSVLAKRAQTSTDALASILSACKTKSALISKVCSHLLPAATAPTSTVTIEQTSTSTTVVEFTTTAVETATNTVTATVTTVAQAQATPFANGAFTGSLSPWTVVGTHGATASNVQFLKKQAVCLPSGLCTESDLVRFSPPLRGYVAVVQTFDALPSTTYRAGLHMNAPAGTIPNILSIVMVYNEVELGTHVISSANTASPYLPVSIWEFTTDASGRGTLEVRVRCDADDDACGFIYLDNISVVKKAV